MTKRVWQLFHENSKGTRFRRPLQDKALLEWQKQLAPSLTYEGHPAVKLAAPMPLTQSLGDALAKRTSATALRRAPVSFGEFSTLLHYAYGITRPAPEGQQFPAGYRAVPSGGALYPLELYVHVAAVGELVPGLYHYEPPANAVRRIVDGDQTANLLDMLAQPAIVEGAAAIVFITALFERTTTKYGERGYRFALIEAGHVAQNLALCASALELPAVPVGGFHDRAVDEFLGIDGMWQSTLYLFALGGWLAP